MKKVSPFRESRRTEWVGIAADLRIVTLDPKLMALVPALALSSLSKSTRGLTLYPGRTGVALGAMLLVASAVIAYLLYAPVGVIGVALSAWLVGSVGALTLAVSLEPTAFVKSICVRCRLLPVIKEHEAIHLSGVASEKAVWDSMKVRHSVESLALAGDPAICTFCPIPKRLAEQ